MDRVHKLFILFIQFTEPMTKFLIIVLFFLVGFDYLKTVPLSNAETLRKLKQLNDKKYETSKCIIIYTYIQCKPCLALANKINKKINSGLIDERRIIYLNVFNNDSTQIADRINLDKYSSAYFILKYPPDMEGMYPKISFYNQMGQLDSTIYGYSTTNLNLIEHYLLKKQ